MTSMMTGYNIYLHVDVLLGVTITTHGLMIFLRKGESRDENHEILCLEIRETLVRDKP